MSHVFPNAIHLPDNVDPADGMEIYTDEDTPGAVVIRSFNDWDILSTTLDRGNALTAILGIMRAAGIGITEVTEASATGSALDEATECWTARNTWDAPTISPEEHTRLVQSGVIIPPLTGEVSIISYGLNQVTVHHPVRH